MSIDIDLDIKNYTITDIEYFLGLDKLQKYSESDIESHAYDIREQLFSAGDFNTRFKRSFIDFVTTAKQRLIDEKITPSRPKLTMIPKNSQLDVTDFPRSESAGRRDDELIEHPETPRIYSQPSEFFSGILNPLNNRIITRCLTVDTRFRENISSTKSTDFIIQLPTKLTKVVSMRLSSLELPVSFYGISNTYGNNFINITLTYSNNTTPENHTFIIPDGNYASGDLINKLNYLTGSNNPIISNQFSYIKFSLDSITGKVTISTLANSIITNILIDFTLDSTGNKDLTTPISTKFGANLGFIHSEYNGSLSYAGESVIQPCLIRYLYLSVDDYNNNVNNNFMTAFNQSLLSQNILGRIAVNGNYFGLITDNDLNTLNIPREYFGPVDIQRLHIRLFDDYGRILDINNNNFSFCLTFKTLYNL
jgi:hypothetical protein